MMSLTVFNFEGTEVRFVGTATIPEWVAQDVCNVLDIQDTSGALRDFDSHEKGVRLVSTPSGEQSMLTVTEPGLYRLIFKSRKDAAKRFQKWVFEEVLPQIRKTGSYNSPAIANVEMAKMFGDMMSQLAVLTERVDKTDKLEAQIEETKMELNQTKNQLEEVETILEEQDEKLEVGKEEHPGAFTILFNNVVDDDIKEPVTVKQYCLFLADLAVDLTRSVKTIEKRSAQFYRCGKGKEPLQVDSKFYYYPDELIYIKRAIHSVFKECGLMD